MLGAPGTGVRVGSGEDRAVAIVEGDTFEAQAARTAISRRGATRRTGAVTAAS
jgi:hypothetical protein